MILDSRIINHSRWEPVWKWDSFGGAAVTKMLFTGEFLDHGRLPAFSLLAVVGAIVCVAISVEVGGTIQPEPSS